MKQTSKKIVVILWMVLALLFLGGTAAYADITGASGIAMDYDTGEVLYAKDADTMRVPASMTKIMTAYILYEEMEKGNLTKESMIPGTDFSGCILSHTGTTAGWCILFGGSVPETNHGSIGQRFLHCCG